MRRQPGIKARSHLPNLLSLSRIGLGVLFFLFFQRGSSVYSALSLAVIGASMLTDYLDGTLARRNNTVTLVGKWIDPLSDFSFFFFVYLSFYKTELMPLVLLILFLLREISMYTLVRPLYYLKKMDTAAKIPGKIKTAFQSAGSLLITFLVLLQQLGLLNFAVLRPVSLSLLCLMVSLSLISMYWYVSPLVVGTGSGAAAPATRRVFRLTLLTVSSLLVFQLLYSAVVTAVYALPLGRFLTFSALTAVYHCLILVGCLAVRREFRLVETGEPLQRANLPLYLSFIRFSAVPTLVFLFLCIESIEARFALVPFLAFILLTDLLDGMLARRLKLTTRIGRILDAAGDYLLILALSIVYLRIGFIPTWLFPIVLVRLLIQAVGNVTLYVLRGYPYLKLTFLGKASIFAIFTLYGFELLEYLKVPVIGASNLVWALELATAGIVGLSLLEKILLLIRSFLRVFRPRDSGSAQ